MSKLIVVGTGIKSVSHLSQETIAVIKQSEKVLYLVNEPLMKEWIERESKCCESLDNIYFLYEKRIDSYQAISNFIVSENEKHSNICVVFYGHPVTFASSALSAVLEIRGKGEEAIILPAISSLDCLFADLAIDPGDHGCYSIDATDFLIFNKKFDIRSHLILWQVGNVGTYNQDKTKGISILQQYLLEHYNPEHRVCLYEASQYPSVQPRVDFFQVLNLDKQEFTSISTLYIPPITNAIYNMEMIKKLGMNIANFQLS